MSKRRYRASTLSLLSDRLFSLVVVVPYYPVIIERDSSMHAQSWPVEDGVLDCKCKRQ